MSAQIMYSCNGQMLFKHRYGEEQDLAPCVCPVPFSPRSSMLDQGLLPTAQKRGAAHSREKL